MSEKKKKRKIHLECLEGSTLNEQTEAFENAIQKLDDADFEKVDESCIRIVKRLRYNSIQSKIDYNDGLELLAKLGMFLAEDEGRRLTHAEAGQVAKDG